MQLTTTFRGMLPSPALRAQVERSAARLEQFYERIVACHVAIEKPHRHHLHGSPFWIHITLVVPGTGTHIAVSKHHHEDPYVALWDAFRAARRQLIDHADLLRHYVKPRALGGRARYGGLVADRRVARAAR
jgi:ribosome-associated translation inhibitor RaiA